MNGWTNYGSPNYARGNLYTTAVSSYTMLEDGYVVFSITTTGTTSLQIDGVTVSVVARTGASGADWAISSFSGFVKQGSILTITSGAVIDLQYMKVFGFA